MSDRSNEGGGAVHFIYAGRAWAVLALVCGSAGGEEVGRFRAMEPHMGVEFEVVLYAPDETAAKSAQAAAFARIARLNAILSDYDSGSEALRLCASAPHDAPVPVSEELWSLLRQSAALHRQTDGAFDVTIGPLTRIWRRARRQKELPGEKSLQDARQAVGQSAVELAADRPAVRLTRAGMRLDFGGIAKGYAAEEALRVIRDRGFKQALVRGSGDIAAGDPPPGELGWKVALAPLNPDDRPTEYLLLKNACVSTSGDARQHLVVDGKRYSHVLDPRTGSPVASRSSVTVVAPTGATADGLATALSVLGPEAGMRIIDATEGASAMMVVEQDGKQQRSESQKFGPTRAITPEP